MKKLALLGASGHGKVVAEAALESGWKLVEFFDDAFPEVQINGDWRVVGDTSELIARQKEFDGVVVTIGDCKIRLEKHRLLKYSGVRMVSIVHPKAVIARGVRIGAGSVLVAGSIVNVDCTIGDACIVNTGATLDHDGHLEDGVHLSPGSHLGGGVHVGEGSWIGIGALVLQCLNVGENVIVGSGAVVTSSVANGMTMVGNPARVLEKRRGF